MVPGSDGLYALWERHMTPQDVVAIHCTQKAQSVRHGLSVAEKTKRDTWHQPTPLMQLISIVGCGEGHAENYASGIKSVEEFAGRSAELFKELQELMPHVQNGCWIA